VLDGGGWLTPRPDRFTLRYLYRVTQKTGTFGKKKKKKEIKKNVLTEIEPLKLAI
jgi:hypothetical protein